MVYADDPPGRRTASGPLIALAALIAVVCVLAAGVSVMMWSAERRSTIEMERAAQEERAKREAEERARQEEAARRAAAASQASGPPAPYTSKRIEDATQRTVDQIKERRAEQGK